MITAASTAMPAITAITTPQLRRRVSGTRGRISCGPVRIGCSAIEKTSVGVERISVSGSGGGRSMICVEPASKPGAV